MGAQLQKLAISGGSHRQDAAQVHMTATGWRGGPRARHSVAWPSGWTTLGQIYGTLTMNAGSAESTPGCVHRVDHQLSRESIYSTDRSRHGTQHP